MDPQVSIAELARLIAVEQHRVYPFDEVAQITRFSLRKLERLAREDKVEHIHEGNTRGMTLDQIKLLVNSRKRGTTDLQAVATLQPADDLAAAINASRSAASRGQKRAA